MGRYIHINLLFKNVHCVFGAYTSGHLSWPCIAKLLWQVLNLIWAVKRVKHYHIGTFEAKVLEATLSPDCWKRGGVNAKIPEQQALHLSPPSNWPPLLQLQPLEAARQNQLAEAEYTSMLIDFYHLECQYWEQLRWSTSLLNVICNSNISQAYAFARSASCLMGTATCELKLGSKDLLIAWGCRMIQSWRPQ